MKGCDKIAKSTIEEGEEGRRGGVMTILFGGERTSKVTSEGLSAEQASSSIILLIKI